MIASFVLLAGFDAISFGNRAFADDLSKTQDALNSALKKKEVITKQLDTSKVLLQKNVVQVNTTKTVLQQTESDIARKQGELEELSRRAQLNKAILENYLQQIYFTNLDPLVELAVTNRQTSDIAENFDQLLSIKERINITLTDISQNEEAISNVKSELADKKAEHEKLLQKQKAEQGEIVSDINDATATLQELNDKINKLRSDLSSLLGVNVSTDDVKKAAGIASDATGVRKSFILGELTQESGLGRYTGGCTYKNTRVKPADATVFKQIMKELGYGINDKKISCAGKIGYGGAMGIAQFMPTTWTGYKSYISGATGHNPPDPWSVIDGVMGMAKKLANGGATSKSGEFAASMRYYCGTSTPSNATIKAACRNYASNVQRLANGYEKN